MSSCSERPRARHARGPRLAARGLGRARIAAALFVTAQMAPPAHALNVHALYRAACDRVLGVILGVDKREVHLIDLAGREVTVPRHEIVSLAYYPVSSLPISRIRTSGRYRPLRVQTRVEGQLVDLVEGWPIDFSEQKIAFLQHDGKELVINRDSLWALTFTESAPAGPEPAAPAVRDLYMHPQASGFCGDEAETGGRRYFPQQFLNDEVVIKRELDRLREGYEQVLEYVVDQRFYAVPQLYQNRTALGVWLPFGSRHGASTGRTNLAPLVIDELSLGPFRYQHVFITGSAPNHFFLHEEPQTQIYYRFKAAYFHASVMFDPTLVLVGQKYAFRKDDFSGRTADDRLAEFLALELGFDLGPLSLQLFPAVVTEIGWWIPDPAAGTPLAIGMQNNLLRGGPRVSFHRFEGEVLVGASADSGAGKYRFVRANLGAQLGRVSVGCTLIARSTEFVGLSSRPRYRSTTFTNAARAHMLLGRRFGVEAFVSLERHGARWGDAHESREARLYPKLGLSTTFWF